MSGLILDYFTRDACTFPACDEPPRDGAATCEDHRNVRVSSWGSWLEVESA